MLKVPSISTQVGSQTSTPLRWCCDPDPSRTTPLSVAPSSGWCHEFLSGRHAPAAGPRSYSRLDWTATFLLMQNFYQHSIFPADYTVLFLFMQKLRKCWGQYWQGISKQYACVNWHLAILETAIFDNLFIKSNISAMDRLVVVKFQINIANVYLKHLQ